MTKEEFIKEIEPYPHDAEIVWLNGGLYCYTTPIEILYYSDLNLIEVSKVRRTDDGNTNKERNSQKRF